MLRLIRVVTQDECPWLVRDFHIGEVVHRYSGATYGCVTPSGIACSIDGDIPFFELPADSIEPIFASKAEERRFRKITEV